MTRRKKLILIVSFLLAIVILFIVLRRPKDYSIEYQKDGYTITESYKKNVNMYYFSLKYKDKTYDIGVQNEYLQDKKLITKIDTLEGENYTCVYLKSNNLKTYPACYLEDDRIDYSLIENTDENFYKTESVEFSQNTYDNIKVNTLLNHCIAIWNHKGFTYLKNNKSKSIKLIDNESYYDAQSFQIGKYVLIPNYDENHEFQTFYVLDLSTGNYKTWEMEDKISFNFYYLGEYDGKGYIVDKKSKEEYAINPKKRTIELVTKKGMGKIWNGSWTEVSMTKLVNTEYSFEKNKAIDYTLENDKLYMAYYKSGTKVLVSNQKIDRIVSTKDDEIYYLVKNQLYRYSPTHGEIKIAEYSEWEFNNLNTIYIY